MSISCKFYYDGKNDKHEIVFEECENVQLVYVGGRAMEDLFSIKEVSSKDECGVASAIFEYLSSKGLKSTKDTPRFILPTVDLGEVEGSLGIDPDLMNICKKLRASVSL